MRVGDSLSNSPNPHTMTPLHIALPHEKRPFFGGAVLMFYDGPQIFWLPHDSRQLLAIGLPGDAGQWPFLVVELTAEQARTLQSDETTLQAACMAACSKWVMRDYGADALELEPLSAIPADWLPGDVPLGLDGGRV
jgi:hypothetical protein